MSQSDQLKSPVTDFFQEAPQLHNQFDSDRALKSLLRRILPAELYAKLEPDLRRLGHRAATELVQLARDAELTPPRHIPFDPWGRRVDHIEVSSAWKHLDRIAAEEGLVAVGYERREGAYSRIHQFGRLYLFAPSSAVYSCPLAMTDGAARALELYGSQELKDRALARFISRNPEQFWTSGQWMTERTGGSDVSLTETVAREEGGTTRLYGTKFFTSATTSQVAMTLARFEGAPEGSRGLSLFYLELRDANVQLQNIEVHRLKDKLGTKALPTAELTLKGTPATLVGEAGNGVKNISALFNITRIYNAVCSTATIRRGIALARDYAHRRRAFGQLLAEHELHRETLAEVQMEHFAALHLTFKVAELLGLEEVGEATPEQSAVLRLLIPLAKLYTAKQAIQCSSEVLESFGGAGYVEDTGLPALLRDSQVLSIWEGTTNVLSMDVLRAIRKSTVDPFVRDMSSRISGFWGKGVNGELTRIGRVIRWIEDYAKTETTESPESFRAGARGMALMMARSYVGTLLLEHGLWSVAVEGDRTALEAARLWCRLRLKVPVWMSPAHLAVSRAMALDEDLPPETR